MLTTAESTRHCTQCGELKPLTQFRRRSRDGTIHMSDCNTCHARAERKRNARKRAERECRMLADFADRLKTARHRRVLLLCETMFRHFGGVDAFAQALADHFNEAKAGTRRSPPQSR